MHNFVEMSVLINIFNTITFIALTTRCGVVLLMAHKASKLALIHTITLCGSCVIASEVAHTWYVSKVLAAPKV